MKEIVGVPHCFVFNRVEDGDFEKDQLDSGEIALGWAFAILLGQDSIDVIGCTFVSHCGLGSY